MPEQTRISMRCRDFGFPPAYGTTTIICTRRSESPRVKKNGAASRGPVASSHEREETDQHVMVTVLPPSYLMCAVPVWDAVVLLESRSKEVPV
jgi:hypothetical protein